jgi:hypothetical protein
VKLSSPLFPKKKKEKEKEKERKKEGKWKLHDIFS